MSQNYAGRVTLIIVVLLVGLFGIPGLTDGIFSAKRFVNPSVPFNEKLNLRPGIDIAGGTSLLYEIKPPPGGARNTNGNLAEQVAALLKKRVDPTGTRNLIWRPQGDTRLEIQLPRSSMTKEGSGKLKTDYAALKKQIDDANIASAQVINVVENLSSDARDKELKRLAAGNTQREALFGQLRSLFDKIKNLDAQLADLRKPGQKNDTKINDLSRERALASIAYDEAKARIEQANLTAAEVEAILDSADADKAKQLAELKARFPERKATIDKLEELHPKYLATKNSIDDASDLKRLLRGSGVLEFHILVENPPAEQPEMIKRLDPGGDGPAPQANDQSRWFEVDKPEEFRHGQSNPFQWHGKSYVLAWTTPDKSMVHRDTGRDWALQRAYPTGSQRGDLIVGFEFDDAGAQLFSALTGNNINKPLGTVLDNKIITAPNIHSQIGKSGTIDGGSNGYTEGERNYLINTLNAGSLPAQLDEQPISEREVGPQLGEANLRSGMFACVAGLFVVACFMIFYYHLTGVVAVIAVVFNLIVIIGVLAMMGATFTLPGIAGLVLTIGVSVDANVLIFERLREEEMRGLSLKLAMRNAYDRAFTAILDSNVTTAITSAFLIYFGSEEVKGFGLTLLIGILSSMFAALFVTRTIFGIMIEKYGVRKLGSFPLSYPKWNKIMHPNIDWMSKIPYFLGFSVVFIVLGLIALVQQGRQGKVLDVEFAAGTEVQFTTNRPMTDNEVRDRVAKRAEEIPQPAVVAVGDQFEKGKYKTFSVVTANDNRKQVSQAIFDVMHDALDVAVPSKFEQAGTPFDAALKAGAIQPVVLTKNRFLVNGQEVPDAPQFAGGEAIILNNIDPPLAPDEIYSRINRALLGSNDADSLKQIRVNRIDGNTGQTPTTSAVVLVANKNFDYAKSPSDWREKLASPAWKVVNEGIGKEASLQKVSNFDAQVAGDTQRAALFATLGSILAIMVWIWLRFGDHKYGTATVAAMIHDTIMVVGAIGLAHWLADTTVGRMLGVEAFRLNMTLVAAILTVMGYSMVDTIVVFDRIRENRGKYGSISRALINDSVNQTLSRTLLTAGTTMMTLFVMYVWGGPAIHGFTFILLIGILIGTYSSIAIAAPILLIGAKQPQTGGQRPAKVTGAAGIVSGAGAVQKV
jgi:SecD/SecF fusion protein